MQGQVQDEDKSSQFQSIGIKEYSSIPCANINANTLSSDLLVDSVTYSDENKKYFLLR